MKTPSYHKAVASLAVKNPTVPHIALGNVHYSDGSATAGNPFRMMRAKSPAFNGIEGNRLRDLALLADKPDIPLVLIADAPTFPDFDRIVNDATDGEPVASFSLNVNYILDIAKAVAPFTSSLNDVTIEYYGNGRPVVFKTKNPVKHTDAIALVMPLRT